jgi:DNA-binding IclR family transcriptional regulator
MPAGAGVAQSRITAVERAITVLDLLSVHGEALAAAVIAQHCRIPRSSTYHLLNVLAARGYVDYHPAPGRWTIGRRLVEIGADVPTLAQAMALLEQFDRSSPWHTVNELAVRSGLTVRQAQAVLDALATEGLVDRHDGVFGLGLRLVRLAGRIEQTDRIRLAARPSIVALRDRTRETANLLIRDGSVAVYLDQVESPRTLRVSGWVGRTIPLTATSAGAAFLRPSEVHVVSDGVERGITGVACFVPIAILPPAVVSVTGPTFRLLGRSLRLVKNAVQDAACEIAAALQ